MDLVGLQFEPVSLDVNKICYDEKPVSLMWVKNLEKVKALLSSVDVGNKE